jgi:hypothetical protein
VDYLLRGSFIVWTLRGGIIAGEGSEESRKSNTIDLKIWGLKYGDVLEPEQFLRRKANNEKTNIAGIDSYFSFNDKCVNCFCC